MTSILPRVLKDIKKNKPKRLSFITLSNKYNIGYIRAYRLFEKLINLGVVEGQPNNDGGLKSRKVLLNVD